MNKNNNLALIAVIAVIIAVVIWGIYSSGNNKSSGSSEVGPGSLAELIGKPMPEFSLKDKNGVEYSPEKLKGENVVLFFNEGLMCYPACWNQVAALGQDKRFEENNVLAFSVVVDNPAGWQRATEQMPELGYAKILFDTDRSVSSRFGMLTLQSSMHYGSTPGHTYVLIDKDGIIRFVYDDPTMAINNNLLIEEIKKIE